MRKVNLRNIDSTIDDPDASTWCMSCFFLIHQTRLTHAPVAHPTLRRNSPADVIANFKRRVPPRLPKPRKRPEDSALTSGAPRSAVSLRFVSTVDTIRLLKGSCARFFCTRILHPTTANMAKRHRLWSGPLPTGPSAVGPVINLF